jgi:predicted transcriptional regulator
MTSTRGTSRTLSVDSSAADANLTLLAERATAAVVFDGDRPVGVITLADLAGRSGHGAEPLARVGDLMTHECVAIEPTADEEETLRRYRTAAWRSLLRRHPGDPEVQRRREQAHT